jgi:hypothetical protein
MCLVPCFPSTLLLNLEVFRNLDSLVFQYPTNTSADLEERLLEAVILCDRREVLLGWAARMLSQSCDWRLLIEPGSRSVTMREHYSLNTAASLSSWVPCRLLVGIGNIPSKYIVHEVRWVWTWRTFKNTACSTLSASLRKNL